MMPFISICIPAYKNSAFLKRLLESVKSQTYKNFEVVISDDSPDDALKELCMQYAQSFDLKYQRNNPPYGMPCNWNIAMESAAGEWIKIMHDDDWFVNENCLAAFAEAASHHKPFIYSGYNNAYDDGEFVLQKFPKYLRRQLEKEPMILLAQNIIGPPSACMVHRDIRCRYDAQFKWFVDIEYYIQCIKDNNAIYTIEQPLINFGINKEQITNIAKNNPNIEFSEAFLLLKKYGNDCLKNIIIFDAWWRMCRNMNVQSLEELAAYGNVSVAEIPQPIKNIIAERTRLSQKKLSNSLYSKWKMWQTFLKR